MSYLFIKSLHLIGVVAWFAALFYIFRLYVYHVENQNKPEVTNVLEIMERRLINAIMTPAMIWTLVMGLWMLHLNPQLLNNLWFIAKIPFIFCLLGYHAFSINVRKRFVKGDFFLTSKQCRLINEAPTLVLIVVIPLAIIKPW